MTSQKKGLESNPQTGDSVAENDSSELPQEGYSKVVQTGESSNSLMAEDDRKEIDLEQNGLENSENLIVNEDKAVLRRKRCVSREVLYVQCPLEETVIKSENPVFATLSHGAANEEAQETAAKNIEAGNDLQLEEDNFETRVQNSSSNSINVEETPACNAASEENSGIYDSLISCPSEGESEEKVEVLESVTSLSHQAVEVTEMPPQEEISGEEKVNCVLESKEVPYAYADEEKSGYGTDVSMDNQRFGLNKTEGRHRIQREFSSLPNIPNERSADMKKRSVSAKLPTDHSPLPGTYFPHVTPPDIPPPRVHLKDSSDVQVGTRINYSYVTKVMYTPPASSVQGEHKCQDPSNGDEAMLSSSMKLRLRYSTLEAYMPSLVCYEKSHDFSIKDCYMPLRIDEYYNSSNLKRRYVSLKDIFTSDQQDVAAKRILLTGNPGCGKTAILKKFAFDWSTIKPENNYLSIFDIVLIVNLSNLLDRTVDEMILDALFESRDDKRKEILHQTKLQFLILLDGFDDLGNCDPIVDFLTAKKSCIFSANMTVVLTSRLHCITPIKKCFQCHFHIEGLFEDGIRSYIDFRFSMKPHCGESLKSKLIEQAPLAGISTNPLMLHMLCCLHEEGKLKGRTSTYTEIFCGLVRRHYQKYGWSNRVLQRGDYFLGENLLIKFGKIALKYLNKEICCIKASVLKEEFGNQDEYEFITQLGHLVPSQAFYCNCQSSCSFKPIHEIFLEYTAAVYLSENPNMLQTVLSSKDYKFDISNVIIFLMDMCDDTDILLAVIDPVTLNKKISFDDYYRIVSEVKNPGPFLETLDCCCIETTAENVSSLLGYNETKQLSLYFTFSEFTVEFHKILVSIKECHSLREIRFEKAINVTLLPGVDNWCVSWVVDLMDEFNDLKELIQLEVEANITLTISPKLYVGEIQWEYWGSESLNIVPPYALPEHDHVDNLLGNCYSCAIAYEHEVNVACDGMTFIMPLQGYYLFDHHRYRKLVIFRVPEEHHLLFKESERFLNIAEGFLANKVDFEIW